MKIKVRMIGDKLDSNTMLVDAGKLQLGTKVYTQRFPLTKDVGILTIIEGMKESKNIFQIVVKDSKGELLGKGNIFRMKILSKETGEGVLVYNINKAHFENRDSFYMIELWSGDELIDSFNLGADSDIYNIYTNLDERGTISLL